jgi:hypothetical protein
LGKNEDFLVALWIFRPKTVLFAVVATRFLAVLLCFPRNSLDLAYFRAVVATVLEGTHLTFVRP